TTIFVTHDQEEAMSISDRIVLMKAGALQQSGVPQALYHDPKNQFVADFLGNPPICNLLRVVRGGSFMLGDGSASVSLPMFAGAGEGTRVSLAIRAESAFLDSDGPLACEVRSVYQMGKEEMAYLRFGTAEFRAYIDAENGLKAGDRVRIALKPRGVFLFDAETGARLR
ncbi:MAG: ABC transporter ATP-binding protein, partial [Clostridiales bacterium]|nr:ABC transporter ATP-binding protein [Clostridiales bacterium]